MRKSMGPIPKFSTRNILTTPVVGANNLEAMLETIIHERKWGR
jgi:hypothetical protein